ncbi:MAG: site-specific integrase [Actinobacteria bacterium]|nr:site-specific integrase [Actinomycetota bacterium]
MAAVRPEFRAEVYVPDPDDPVFRSPQCAVDDCDRITQHSGLCNGHSIRWKKRGCLALDEFLTDPGKPIRGRTELGRCAVEGCRYGVNGHGLCSKHHDRWVRAGRPDLGGWTAQAVVVGDSRAECGMPFCSLWVENTTKVFCKNHDYRWRAAGCPDPGQYAADCQRVGTAHIDLRGLGPQMRLEFQYALQRRHDERARTTPPTVVRDAVRQARQAGVASLLDYAEAEWRARSRTRMRGSGVFLLDVRDVVETLRDGAGWEVEYPRDVWRLHKLPGVTASHGQPVPRRRLRFDRVSQLWLRQLGKRWVRLRLTSGLSVASANASLDALIRFSEFLAAVGVDRLAEVDRPLLERYLAWVSDLPGGYGVKKNCVSGISSLLQMIRQHGWDDTLPGTAVLLPGDCPPRPEQVSRQLAEHVMAQVESLANLDRWPDPACRLVTLILVRGGLRISSARTLAFDCVVHDGQGAPYLRYFNTKMRREAAVPIDEEIEAGIRAQQQRVLERWPGGSAYLFPRPHANPAAKAPMADSTYRRRLHRWLRACDVHDEHGRPVRLTPHQWRHTFACRLINRDVPQEVVRVLLDHESSRMTSHYAKITDQTVRRHWEKAAKVNIKGERVAIDPDGPLAQAQWAKTRYGMATQTLPNGYCGLPLQKSCPHANACLTCPVFLTGQEFLPELREQRRRTLTLIDVSKDKGHDRMVEMNQQVLDNLDRMIGEVEKDGPEDAADAG